MQYTYLLVNVFSALVPFVFSFHPRLQFHKTWFAFWPATLITAILFIGWDVLYTHLGVWGFNPDYLTGIYVLNLPLEEWLFFICIPYASVFTYASLKILVRRDIFQNVARSVSLFLSAFLLIVGFWNLAAIYTSVTFIATALFLLFHLKYQNHKYLGRFYLAYVVVFAGPFLLVNGILTGSFIDNPVVWYDDTQNLGWRVFTIPIEDFVYGFLLIFMNINIYEWLIEKRQNHYV